MEINRELVEKVRKSQYALTIENNYKNLAYFSGWVIMKPRFTKHDKLGVESVSIVISQFLRDNKGIAYMKTFNLISYLPNIVEMMKEQDKICFIICDCQMQFNAKTRQLYPQVYDLKIQTTLPLKMGEWEN